jgi:hypothetical protein
MRYPFARQLIAALLALCVVGCEDVRFKHQTLTIEDKTRNEIYKCDLLSHNPGRLFAIFLGRLSTDNKRNAPIGYCIGGGEEIMVNGQKVDPRKSVDLYYQLDGKLVMKHYAPNDPEISFLQAPDVPAKSVIAFYNKLTGGSGSN